MLKYAYKKSKSMFSGRRIGMISGENAAKYIISLDHDGTYFNKNLTFETTVPLYEGNARLNKILHLAQNMYIGRSGSKLIDSDFYAYDNGAVLLEVQENYAMLIATKDDQEIVMEEFVKTFLYKVFLMLKDAPISKLIEIDHQDPAWKEKKGQVVKEKEKMDSLKYADDYRLMYDAANFYLDKMETQECWK